MEIPDGIPNVNRNVIKNVNFLFEDTYTHAGNTDDQVGGLGVVVVGEGGGAEVVEKERFV